MLCLVQRPGGLVLLFSMLLSLPASVCLAQAQPPKDDGVLQTYDKGKTIDKVDIPGRMLASKQIIKITPELFDVDRPRLRYHEKGPDYTVDIPVEKRIEIEGILVGMKGQARKMEVPIEGKRRLVVLQTNAAKGAHLEAAVFVNPISEDDEEERANEPDSAQNQFIAKHAIDTAIKSWAASKTTMTIGYVHYVYIDPAEDFGDDRP